MSRSSRATPVLGKVAGGDVGGYAAVATWEARLHDAPLGSAVAYAGAIIIAQLPVLAASVQGYAPTITATSMLPRVAFDYGRRACAAVTNACVELFHLHGHTNKPV